ncbi:unnamed protein product [Notodromas monacha]|uniref:Uncharacterized protein n=1 Tax=Notodromas monacha TaxID=399045 RepID=A0A7R9C154_9CRUS|nr:unnamed protein product [Notodromas monacha]CAG0924412.1 unnamed protein product [Notodromas monacha]
MRPFVNRDEFLKKIEPEFLEEPAYSVCCRIQAKPTEDKWSHEAVEAFEQLTHNEGHERKFTVKFHHVQGGGNVRYIVDLFDSDGHSVTDKFLSLGHGIALDESENLDDESWLEVKELY